MNQVPPSLPVAFDVAVLEALVPALVPLLLLPFGGEIEIGIVALTRVVVPFRSSPSVLLPFGLGFKPNGAQP